MKEEGFTLVELLAALVAGGLLLAILGYLTGTFGKDVTRAVQTSTFDEIADAAPILEAMLEGTTPPSPAYATFEGDARHLSAEVSPPLAAAGTGPMKLELEVATTPDGEALDAVMTPVDGAVPGFPRRQRLVHGARRIRFDYREDDDSADHRLPRLVILSFGLKNRETWDLAIEPRLNAVAGCRFDPISLACRS